MINEFDNVRNPMLGAYILWNFVLGYFSENNEYVPFELSFIVLPMILKEDIEKQIQSTQKSSGIRMMSDKFMKSDVLKNDLIVDIHKDVIRMRELTINSLSEAVKVGLITIDDTNNKIIPLELKNKPEVDENISKMGKSSDKLGKWCSKLSVMEVEEALKVRF